MWEALSDLVIPFLNGTSVCMAFEWLAACSYWNWASESRDLDGRKVPDVRGCLGRVLQNTALVHGCEHELRAACGPSKGELVRKLWRVDSDCGSLTRALHGRESSSTEHRRSEWRSYRCCHDKSVQHARCAGRVTKDTQHYPVSLARVIHSAWREHVHQTCRRSPSLRPCACAVLFRPSCAPELGNTQSVANFAVRYSGPKGFSLLHFVHCLVIGPPDRLCGEGSGSQVPSPSEILNRPLRAHRSPQEHH